MPELPEAERARAQIERVLGREIASVDDRDTYVCRPHAPGEIDAALRGHRLTEAHRRGKSLWAHTDGGPDLGLHLGMAGRIVLDEPPAPRSWDRFAIEFVDPLEHPPRRSAYRRADRPPRARRTLPALRRRAGPGHDRRAHDVLVPGRADVTGDPQLRVAAAARGDGPGRRRARRDSRSSARA